MRFFQHWLHRWQLWRLDREIEALIRKAERKTKR